MVSIAQSLAEAALDIHREIEINAPVAQCFASVIATLGEENSEIPDMKFEPRPGGRWFRDLGSDTGHLWGHVQVIKPPTLIEIAGPMFMSYAAISHIQYRLIEDTPTRTRLVIHHTAVGLIDPEHREGVQTGWNSFLERVQTHATEQTV